MTFQQVKYTLNRGNIVVMSVIAMLLLIIVSLLLSLIRFVFRIVCHSIEFGGRK